MRLRVVTRCTLALIAFAARPAAAQSLDDFVAWAAMMSTPYGSLPPMVTRAMTEGSSPRGRHSAFELRYAQFSFDGSNDAVHTGGIGMRFGALGLVVGYEGCSGCDGGLIGGVDYEGVVVRQALTGNGAHSLFEVGLRPAVGFGRSLGGGPPATAISATVDVPFSVAVPVGARAKVVPFVSPGFGVGVVRGGGDSERGTRPAIAFGAALAELAPGLGLNLGWRKVFLEGAPTTIGVGLTLDR